MNQKEKRLVDKDVIDIISFHLGVLEMEESKTNLKLALHMFVEGVRYVKEREIEKQKQLLEGFGYKRGKNE